MKLFHCPSWLFSLVLITAFTLIPGKRVALAQVNTEWALHKTADGTHPDGREQQMLWLMNRARANPAAEGSFLAATGDDTTEFAISVYNVDLARMKSEFAAIPAKGPAAFDRRLYEASKAHSDYMIRMNTQTHDGQIDRVNASGFPWSGIRLNIFAYTDNPVYGHASLNIDIGGPTSEGGMQAGRGHRLGIMSSDASLPFLSNTGLALVPENNPSTDIGPYVFSGAYAAASETGTNAFNRFVVGTVWTDKNHNGSYDDGEGLRGVRVQPDQGSWYAVTGLAGGYSIPVTEPGRFRITFSGGASPASYALDLTVGQTSVPGDVETSSLSPIVLPFAATLSRDASGGLTLSWTGGKPPWQVQTSLDPREGWRNLGNPTSDSSMSLPTGGSSGFYRVVSSP